MKKFLPTKIFLVRHGKSEWNGQKRVSGQLDPHLSKKGIQQSHWLARTLRYEGLSAIYTSPLTRAVDTAKPTAAEHCLPIKTRDTLKEIHFGVLQGRFRDGRDRVAQQLWRKREKDKQCYRVPAGESFSDLKRRVIPCVNEILEYEEGGLILIVGHRSTNRVVLGALMQWPEDSWCSLDLGHKYLYEIFVGDRRRVATICLDRHHGGYRHEGFIM
ncbi:MAG: histidine phosphatase family protein [Candidatus Binatia bacterium]